MWVIFINKINTTFRYSLIFSSGTSLFFFFILANSLSYFFNFRAYGDRRRFLITWCNEMRFKLLGTWWMAVCRIRFNLFGIGNFSSSMTFPYTLRILIPMSFKYSKEKIIRTLTNSHKQSELSVHVCVQCGRNFCSSVKIWYFFTSTVRNKS